MHRSTPDSPELPLVPTAIAGGLLGSFTAFALSITD